MKYIRTNEKIYERDFSRDSTDSCIFTTKAWVYKRDIVRQSDSLEDLCDCFLIFCKNKIHYYDDLGEAITFYTHKYKNEGGKLIGGIVTSTGINFVCAYKDESNKLELDQIKINIEKGGE